MKPIEEVASQLDLAELIWCGQQGYADQYGDDDARRLRNVIAAAEILRKHGLGHTAERLLNMLPPEAECLEAGVCRDCGGEVTAETVNEHHPYGATTATERLRRYVCDHCGEL